MAGRNIELTLVKGDDLSPLAWPQEHIDLNQSSATTSAHRNIYMVLQANGIAPDSEAFALVYDLNPSVKDVNSLAPGAPIHVPAVAGGPQFQNLLRTGALVELTVDPEVRYQLNQSIEALQTVGPSISQLSSQSQTQAEVGDLLRWYLEIERRFKRRTDPPLRRGTLLQMLDEAKLLESILVAARQQQRQVTTDEQRQISAIYDDLKLGMTEYGQTLAERAPKAENYYTVTVNIKRGDASRISGLRVYYTYNGLFRSLPGQPTVTISGFKHLGSGQSEHLLPKKVYQIWAAKDGDSNHPLTPHYLLRIDDTSEDPLSVDLSLTGGGYE
jgi:hypothetical protein